MLGARFCGKQGKQEGCPLPRAFTADWMAEAEIRHQSPCVRVLGCRRKRNVEEERQISVAILGGFHVGYESKLILQGQAGGLWLYRPGILAT